MSANANIAAHRDVPPFRVAASLARQAASLTRKKWKDANELAAELATLLASPYVADVTGGGAGVLSGSSRDDSGGDYDITVPDTFFAVVTPVTLTIPNDGVALFQNHITSYNGFGGSSITANSVDDVIVEDSRFDTSYTTGRYFTWSALARVRAGVRTFGFKHSIAGGLSQIHGIATFMNVVVFPGAAHKLTDETVY